MSIKDVEFDQWMKDVDKEVEAICGLSYNDLPDQTYRDWFDCDIPAEEAARMALESEGLDLDDE